MFSDLLSLWISMGGRSTPDIDLRVGRNLKERKRFGDADVALRRGLSKAPNDPRLLVEYALSANDDGRFREALARWEQVRATAPNLPLAWLGCVVNACHLGMQDWAKPVIAEAARRFPDDESINKEAARLADRRRVLCCIDSCTSRDVAGWAAQETITGQIILLVFVNGQERGRVAPWIDRPGVHKAIGIPGYGFFFEFSERLRDGDVVSIRHHSGLPVDRVGCVANGVCEIEYSIPPLGTSTDARINRASIAKRYLTGEGVEIGAFMAPTDLSPDQNIAYYDRFPAEVLRSFDRMPLRPIVAPSIIGEAETLDGLADASFNFLIANHVIEHLRDPILFLKNIARALKSGGRALIGAPDKRHSFDIRRPLTSFDHLVRDHEKGPKISEHDHLFEYATLVDGHSKESALKWIEQRKGDEMPIHYHVWDALTFVDFINSAITQFNLPLQLIYTDERTKEINVVLEKLSPS